MTDFVNFSIPGTLLAKIVWSQTSTIAKVEALAGQHTDFSMADSF